MAKRKVASSNSRQVKPVCRLVSLLPDSSAQRASRDQAFDAYKIAVGIAMIALLGFAGIGVVFTLKHRDTKPDSRLLVEVVENKHVSASPSVPSASTKPKVVTQSSSMPLPSLPSPPMVPPIAPAVESPPAEIGTETLAIPPRELAAKPPTDPLPLVTDDKPRPDPKGEPTRDPQTPVAIIPDPQIDKPRVQAPKIFPDTKPASDLLLPTFGTTIRFYPTSTAAFEAARNDKEKLVLVVHYAGLFEDGAFLSAAVEQFRQTCLLNPEASEAIRQNFICSATKIATSRNVDGRTTGSVVAYFCLSNGSVLHAVPGPVNADVFLREVEWLLEVRKTAAAEYQKDPTRYAAVFRNAHLERYFKYVENLPVPEAAQNVPIQRQMFVPVPFVPLAFPPFLPKGRPPAGPPFILAPVAEPASVAPVAQSPKLPAKCPADLSAQTKVHWLLARQSLAELKGMYVRVYSEFLKESIAP